MKRIRSVAVLPALFTLGNLVCGFLAITVASRIPAPEKMTDRTPSAEAGIGFFQDGQIISRFDAANPVHNIFLCSGLIFLAMIFDALDGHVARLANHSTDFGAQLDSLCDLVTFGVAPAFLMVKMCPEVSFSYRHAIWMIATVFAICAALRLARFNVETGEEDDHLHFSGLPTPAAAAAIAGFALMIYALSKVSNTLAHKVEIYVWVQRGLPLFALVVSLLMVSRIPYPHVVNQLFSGHRSFAHMIGVVFALAAMLAVPDYAVPLVALSYVVVPPIRYFWQRIYSHRTEAEQEPLF